MGVSLKTRGVTVQMRYVEGHWPHGTRTCIKRQKIAYGKFFDFWADEYIYKRIPEDENPPIKGF